MKKTDGKTKDRRVSAEDLMLIIAALAGLAGWKIYEKEMKKSEQ